MEASMNETRFVRINALHEEYTRLPAENSENARQSLKNKIAIEAFHARNDKSHSVEVVNSVNSCLKSYSAEKNEGIPFSKYLFSAIKRKIGSEMEKETLSDKNAGMKFSDDAGRKIRKIRQFDRDCLQFGIADERKRNAKIANALGMTAEEVERLKHFEQMNLVPLETRNADDEKFSIIETKEISEKCNVNAGAEARLLAEIDAAGIKREIAKIGVAFDKKQERAKPYLAALLMRQLLEELSNVKTLSVKEIESLMENISFCDSDLLKEFSENAGNAEWKMPAQQEVARRFNRDKTDASRTMREFLGKLGSGE